MNWEIVLDPSGITVGERTAQTFGIICVRCRFMLKLILRRGRQEQNSQMLFIFQFTLGIGKGFVILVLARRLK